MVTSHYLLELVLPVCLPPGGSRSRAAPPGPGSEDPCRAATAPCQPFAVSSCPVTNLEASVSSSLTTEELQKCISLQDCHLGRVSRVQLYIVATTFDRYKKQLTITDIGCATTELFFLAMIFTTQFHVNYAFSSYTQMIHFYANLCQSKSLL